MRGPGYGTTLGPPCGAKQVGLAEGKLQARRYNSVAPRGVDFLLENQCLYNAFEDMHCIKITGLLLMSFIAEICT